MFYTQIWQHFTVEALPKVFIWRMCLLRLMRSRLLSVFDCLLGCGQLILAVWTVIWLGAAEPTTLSSSPIIDLHGLQALWGHLAPLPAVFGWIDSRGHPSAETRGQLQRPPAHFLPPGVPFWTSGILSIPSTLRCPSANRLRTWGEYSSSLWSPPASSPVAHTGR